MAASEKKARVALVWLTALLTLFAGAPHVQCRCPSGRLKPFCLGFLFHNPAGGTCCCAGEAPDSGGCCVAPDALPAPRAGTKCCACGPHTRGGQVGEAGAIRIQANAPCCFKTLVTPADFAPAPSEPGPAPAASTVADLRSLWAPGVGLAGDRGLLSWQAHLLAPPPTDLIITLQRLTI